MPKYYPAEVKKIRFHPLNCVNKEKKNYSNKNATKAILRVKRKQKEREKTEIKKFHQNLIECKTQLRHICYHD